MRRGEKSAYLNRKCFTVLNSLGELMHRLLASAAVSRASKGRLMHRHMHFPVSSL